MTLFNLVTINFDKRMVWSNSFNLKGIGVKPSCDNGRVIWTSFNLRSNNNVRIEKIEFDPINMRKINKIHLESNFYLKLNIKR